MLLILSGLTSVISRPIDAFSIVTGLLQNITLIGIVVFLIIAVIVRTAQAVSGEKHIYHPHHRKMEQIAERLSQEHPRISFLFQIIFTAILIGVVATYRNVLIIDYPKVTSVNALLGWMLALALDIGYMGLLASLIAQTWNYLRFIFLFPDSGKDTS
jgi:hypothetical protein